MIEKNGQVSSERRGSSGLTWLIHAVALDAAFPGVVICFRGAHRYACSHSSSQTAELEKASSFLEKSTDELWVISVAVITMNERSSSISSWISLEEMYNAKLEKAPAEAVYINRKVHKDGLIWREGLRWSQQWRLVFLVVSDRKKWRTEREGGPISTEEEQDRHLCKVPILGRELKWQRSCSSCCRLQGGPFVYELLLVFQWLEIIYLILVGSS